MRKPASIVIGLGFGDEGKGLTTDYLCSQAKRPLVIRFNGGQQAGHTVTTTAGKRHVFSSFGAGTLRGAATFWSAYCTLSLSALLNEYHALVQAGVSPKLYIDPHCAVTTHYDVLYNRLLEQHRGNGKHGSCGMGFGTTLQRQEKGICLTAEQLLNPLQCQTQLRLIRDYYRIKAKAEMEIDFDSFDHLKEDQRFVTYLEDFLSLLNQAVYVSKPESVFNDPQWDHFIFEGAQGVLLDMDFGYFPHVTRSNTTSKNALELIKNNGAQMSAPEIYCVSRVYHTRHGEGPFVKHSEALTLTNNQLETNVFNDHQGNFRTGPLDLTQVNYALSAEGSISKGIHKNLMLTCVDQIGEDHLPFIIDHQLKNGQVKDLSKGLVQPFKTILLSRNSAGTSISSH